jgi:hypothetical protein
MPDQPSRPLDPMEEAVWRDLAKFFLIAPRLLDEGSPARARHLAE